MRAFEYANPSTKAEAVALLEGGDAQPLAGGTDLISLMKDNVVAPSRLVNLKSIEELQGLGWEEGGGLRIGAVATLDELVADEQVRERFPSLVQAVDGIRSPQLRTMGTVGGELLQRPRCWYYRGGFGLLALRDGSSMIPEGDNRYHAVLGNDSGAYFVNPSSLAPPLISLGATVRIIGPDGEREIPLADLYRTPASEAEREVALEWNELLTDILVPDSGTQNATYEVRQKESLDWPLAAASVALEMDGDVIRSASVVLGHVAPTPFVAVAAQAALEGQSLDAETAQRAGSAAVEGARALSQNGYKIQLAMVATKRAILRAGGVEV